MIENLLERLAPLTREQPEPAMHSTNLINRWLKECRKPNCSAISTSSLWGWFRTRCCTRRWKTLDMADRSALGQRFPASFESLPTPVFGMNLFFATSAGRIHSTASFSVDLSLPASNKGKQGQNAKCGVTQC